MNKDNSPQVGGDGRMEHRSLSGRDKGSQHFLNLLQNKNYTEAAVFSIVKAEAKDKAPPESDAQ